MKKSLIIFLAAIVIYYLQGTLYASGIINQLLLFFIILFSLFYWVKLQIININNSIVKIFTVFLIINIVWFFYASVFQKGTDLVGLLKVILLALLPFFPFYEAGKKGIDLKNILFVFILIFFIVSYTRFLLFDSLMKTNYNMDLTVNNIGYNFILLLPMLLISKRKLFTSISILLIIIFFVIISSKRGALLCLSGGVFGYMVYLYKKMNRKQQWKKVFTIGSVFLVVIVVFVYFMKQNEFFLSRFDNVANNTSGRDVIIKSMYKYWTEKIDAITLLSGFGFASSFDVCGGYAHNDWVEVLFDYGLIGLVAYIFLLFSIYNRGKKEHAHIEIRYVLLLCLIIWILKSITTGVFTGETTFLLSIALGYSTGLQDYYNSPYKKQR